jgi:hypothetical protein
MRYNICGHEFLEYMREIINRKKIKVNAAQIGCYSLGLLCQIGTNLGVSGLGSVEKIIMAYKKHS